MCTQRGEFTSQAGSPATCSNVFCWGAYMPLRLLPITNIMKTSWFATRHKGRQPLDAAVLSSPAQQRLLCQSLPHSYCTPFPLQSRTSREQNVISLTCAFSSLSYFHTRARSPCLSEPRSLAGRAHMSWSLTPTATGLNDSRGASTCFLSLSLSAMSRPETWHRAALQQSASPDHSRGLGGMGGALSDHRYK